ncbi:MAG TPA: hypothetical protein VFX98_09895 [Longimicrobiaceae bacterium]|nr:hypothetical protein [Longimicrobiaceae bacterium]
MSGRLETKVVHQRRVGWILGVWILLLLAAILGGIFVLPEFMPEEVGLTVGLGMAGVLVVLEFLALKRWAVRPAVYELEEGGIRMLETPPGGGPPLERHTPWADVREWVLETEPYVGGGQYLEVRTHTPRGKLRINCGTSAAQQEEFQRFCEEFQTQLAVLDARTPGVADRIPQGRSWFDGTAARVFAAMLFLFLVAMWGIVLVHPRGFDLGDFSRIRLLWFSLLAVPFLLRVLFFRPKREETTRQVA